MYNKEYFKQYRIDNKEKLNTYQRLWCKKNREKRLICENNWRRNNPEKIKVLKRRYYLKHRDEIIEKTKQYYKENKEKVSARHKIASKKYRDNNKEKVGAQIKKWNINNKERISKKQKIWRENNKEKYLSQRRVRHHRYKLDINYRLNQNLRSDIWHALKDKKAGRHWEILVGYTIKELISHLEKQFDENMNWNNYGSYWNIDHKRPRSWFKFKSSDDQEFKDCWSLSNLQPLERIENIKKGNRYESI